MKSKVAIPLITVNQNVIPNEFALIDCLNFFCSSLYLVTMDPSQHPQVKLCLQHGSQQAESQPGVIQCHLKTAPVPHQNTTLMHCTTTTLQLLLERCSITDLLVRLTWKPLPPRLFPRRESLFRKGTNLRYVLPFKQLH